jgi:drug/metabolite transporter (DMT)-like permease
MSGVALLLVLGAAVAHAAWNVVAHGSSRSGLPFLWWGAVTSTVLWAIAVPFTGGLFTGDGGDLTGFLLGIGVSAVLHVVYMLVLQRGYAAGDLSTVYATARGSGPLLTVLVAVMLLGERLTVPAVIGVVTVIAGVVAIGFVDRRPGGRRGPDRAVVFGLLTGVAIAAYTVWDTFALRRWEASPVAFMVGCTALEVVLFTVLLGRRRAALGATWRMQWRRLLVFGILSPLSYILVLTAVTIAPVALVAPVREVSVVLVSLFGAFVLREARPGRRVAASILVVVGIVLLAL